MSSDASLEEVLFMSWFLRGALVIGTIFYLSPVRHSFERQDAPADQATRGSLERLLAASGQITERDWAQIEKLWASLPAPAQAALLDHLRQAAREGRSTPGRDELSRSVDTLRAVERGAGSRGDLRSRLLGAP
jgi:hypothetical protein